MKYKYIKFNIVYFMISYILLCGIVLFMSYKFFLNDFLLIEKEQNKNNIEILLNEINKSIETLKKDTDDYTNFDSNYEFMKNKNKQYIYVNNKNKLLSSQYSNEYLKANKKDFENFLIEKFKNSDTVNTIINYNSKLLYVFKNQVKKTDKTGQSGGYIFTAKLVDSELFSKKYLIFGNIKIGNILDKTFDFDIKLEYLNSQITIFIDDKYLVNNIQFFDKNNEYIMSLVTTSERDLVKNSKKTIMIFNLILFVIMFFIFFFIYKNQYFMNNQNDLLNRQVERKTRRVKNAYLKIREKNKELYNLANIDPLTKIRNRRSYFIESSNLLEKAILNNQSLDVAIIDIDDFKKINDRYGHAVGDEVLISFCNIVNNTIDKNILFGRFGGEEFCLTFYNKEEQEVLSICESIRFKCANMIFQILNHEIFFTISIGLNSINSSEDTIDKILHRADLLLYEAKNSGKNRLIRKIV